MVDNRNIKKFDDLSAALNSDKKLGVKGGPKVVLHNDMLGSKWSAVGEKLQSAPHTADITGFERDAKRLEEYKARAADYKGKGLDATTLEKMATDQEKALQKNAAAAHKALGTTIEHHANAVTHLEAERAAIEKKLAEAHSKALSDLNKEIPHLKEKEVTRRLETLNHNHDALREEVGKRFDGAIEHHKTKLEGLGEQVGKVKDATKVEASEHMSEKALAAIGGKGGAGATKWYSFKNREFSLGKGAGQKVLHAAGAAVGLGAIWVGAKNIARGTGMSTQKDEQGNEVKAGVGTLILGVGELAGGALLTMNMLTRGKGAALAR
jgi:hypothetical protein